MNFKLGKLPPVYDSRTLRLENYLNVPELPPLPETTDWFAMMSKPPMLGNDEYGDCVVAGAAHMVQAWSANASREHFIPEKKVVQTYLNLSGGADTGLNMLDFLKYWRKTGLDGHKIGAFAALDPKNLTSIRYANYFFGGVYFGFNLPQSIKGQKVWDVPAGGPVGKGAPGSLGGHCVNGGVATPRIIKVDTWGEEQTCTVNFVGTYADEAWAIISLDWFTKDHHTPSGFYWRELLAALGRVAG
jgi:hypothetical protein